MQLKKLMTERKFALIGESSSIASTFGWHLKHIGYLVVTSNEGLPLTVITKG